MTWPNPINKILHVKLCYVCLHHSDWLFNILQPIRALQISVAQQFTGLVSQVSISLYLSISTYIFTPLFAFCFLYQPFSLSLSPRSCLINKSSFELNAYLRQQSHMKYVQYFFPIRAAAPRRAKIFLLNLNCETSILLFQGRSSKNYLDIEWSGGGYRGRLTNLPMNGIKSGSSGLVGDRSVICPLCHNHCSSILVFSYA